jgi:hypothetical protein
MSTLSLTPSRPKRRGHNRAISLVRQGALAQVLDFGRPAYHRPEHLLSDRPLLLDDFFDNSLAAEVRLRRDDLYMRVSIGPPDLVSIPRP